MTFSYHFSAYSYQMYVLYVKKLSPLGWLN